MHLLFSMSLAGSLVFLFYLCIRPATLRYFPAVWRYRFLKVTLLFYLVPYQYYKPKYLEVLRKIFPSLDRKLNEKPVDPVWDMSKFILIDAKGHWHFKNQMFYLAAAAVWIMVVGGFIFIQVLILKVLL